MKKTVKKEVKKGPVLFYANADKLARAKKLASKPADVLKEYEAMGGALLEGRGIEQV